ncbi:nucleotidyltransferase domain-containing protein [candidate division KSB1 bacterium]|nr:MAG: nucleotidyltransferase domain-containing protein [candidate division KSB1 bacterium]MBC6950530.1 nucleotidyltransferase domain-containing protein [candidate division KSB1 bacterium]MCE7945421.1 nucleotidyltransferase domain-containing protein [Chlorobi bacterium CHB1]MDL1875904.1 nucleotidyltransferase domain-containing protein [Cytophagia bacterium CHB2]
MNNRMHKKLQQALACEAAILFAYLFGSAAVNETTPLSDIDIAVFPAKKLSLDERLGIIQRLGKKTALENLDVTFLDRLENLYLMNSIFEQGILLLDRDRDHRELFEVMAHHRFLDFQYQRKLYLGV